MAPAATKAPEATRAAAGPPPGGAATSMPAYAQPLPATAAPAATYAPQPSGQNFPPYIPPYPYPQGSNPPDNYFQDYGINGYVDARRDHLSTFAVDVDTAAYTLARRYIQGGSRPPADAVRVEEFVNYFNPGYNPPAEAAFAIYADGAPSPFEPGLHLVRIGVQGYVVPDRQRKPSALTFVIDVSGSMNLENRLGLVKQALRLLVNRLRPTDTVSIVAYDTSATLVLGPTPVSRRDSILYAVDLLRTAGSTNVDAGLRLGFKQAMSAYRPDGNNRIILCSDGVANTGNVNPNSILEYVGGFIREGVSLSTFGFGMGNYNDALLERLADKGNGSYAYVDTLDEAQRLFVENLRPRSRPSPKTPRSRSISMQTWWRATACWATKTGPSPTRISATTASTPARSGPGTMWSRCTPSSSGRGLPGASPPSNCAGLIRRPPPSARSTAT